MVSNEPPTAPAHFATIITKPSENVDYDSDAADVEQAMALFLSTNVSEVESFGFSHYVVGMTAEEPPTRITEENVPKTFRFAAVNHSCIICHMGGIGT